MHSSSFNHKLIPKCLVVSGIIRIFVANKLKITDNNEKSIFISVGYCLFDSGRCR